MIHFLLPVYNEAHNLPRLLETIAGIALTHGLKYDVVAVDDGSTDDSASTLERLKDRYPLRILRHDRNQGPGAAFRTGFDDILGSAGNDDFIITMDADNTHGAETVGMIVSSLRDGQEIVIASVYAPEGGFIGVPFARRLLSHLCNFLYRIFFPMRGIREYTGFFRGYRADTLRTARRKLGGDLFTAAGFGSMAELLIRLRRVSVSMSEVPMQVRYDRKGGVSKMRIWRTVREHLKIIGRNLFRRPVA